MAYSIKYNILNVEKALMKKLRDELNSYYDAKFNLNECYQIVADSIENQLNRIERDGNHSFYFFRSADEILNGMRDIAKYGSPCSFSLNDESYDFLQYILMQLLLKEERLAKYYFNEILDLVSSLHIGVCVSLLSDLNSLKSSRDLLEMVKCKGRINKEDVLVGYVTDVNIKQDNVFVYNPNSYPELHVYDESTEKLYTMYAARKEETKILIVKKCSDSGCTESFSEDEDIDIFKIDEYDVPQLESEFGQEFVKAIMSNLEAPRLTNNSDSTIHSDTRPVGERSQKSIKESGDDPR